MLLEKKIKLRQAIILYTCTSDISGSTPEKENLKIFNGQGPPNSNLFRTRKFHGHKTVLAP